MSRIYTKIEMIALFLKMNFDHLLIICCALNWSAYDKVERAMSPINIFLDFFSTKREVMSDWIEMSIKNCTSMKDVREAEKKKKMKILNLREHKRIEDLNMIDTHNFITEIIKKVLDHFIVLTWNVVDPERDVETSLSVANIIISCIEIITKAYQYGDHITTIVDIEDGAQITHSSTIAHSIVKENQKEAEEVKNGKHW